MISNCTRLAELDDTAADSAEPGISNFRELEALAAVKYACRDSGGELRTRNTPDEFH
jgi:hypothetical protein